MSIFGEVTPGEGPAPTGFNFGAFLLSGVFLLGYGRFGTFFMLLAAGFVLPLLGPAGVLISMVVTLGVGLKCGFAAKQIAWETGRFATHAELERSMRRWNIAGVVIVGIIVALLIIAGS